MESEDVNRLSPGFAPVAAMLGMLGLTLFLLHRATQDPEQFGRFYPALLVISGTELVVLVVLIGGNLARLVRQVRSQATGSRLSVRLIVVFVLLAVAPVSVVYYFSLEFLRRGIDNFFDVSVDSALTSAITLSRSSIDERMRDQLRSTERVAQRLSDVGVTQAPYVLDEFRDSLAATELTLLTASGRIVATSGANALAIVPNQPHDTILLQLRQGHSYVGLDPMGEEGLHVRVVVNVPRADRSQEPYVLQSLVAVPGRISKLLDAVQNGYAQYEEMGFMRGPLKFIFTLTLSLVLVLTLFAAVWAAFYSARRLVAPIRVLAIGTRLVSAGDYGKRLPLVSNDELGFLVQSFNEMTKKIAQARDEAARSQTQAEGQRRYLEAVLGRLSSGVLVIDERRNLRTANAVAGQILGTDIEKRTGQPLQALIAESPLLGYLINAITPHLDAGRQEWREEVTVFGASGRQVLMCRGAALGSGGAGNRAHVVVFDDITALVQAQRDAAWGEVARRLAHEIKNPLTPIQLSAERLRHKYLKSMSEKDAEVLDRATHTIVQQVEVMKEMVKAFSEYARTPKLELRRLDLNRLVDDVVELYRGHHGAASVETSLDPALPPVEADTGRLRQLLHNLIKNAQEATAEGASPWLRVATAQPAKDSGMRAVELTVEDNGPGIPEELVGRIFDPYVTTKPKGSGLGLAIVKKIVEEHGGSILAQNRTEGGARIIVRLPQRAIAAEREAVGAVIDRGKA
jgi:nitrogen fixation/metabolism regulation signal transduction histidine kinase